MRALVGIGFWIIIEMGGVLNKRLMCLVAMVGLIGYSQGFRTHEKLSVT